jgi:nucleoid DNA-binding protein
MSASQQGKALTKTELINNIADATSLSKKEVSAVLTSLEEVIRKQIGKKGPGVFALPGLIKILRHKKPARPARQGRNPATGEPMTFQAKPAQTVVKVRPLKNLKEMIQ